MGVGSLVRSVVASLRAVELLLRRLNGLSVGKYIDRSSKFDTGVTGFVWQCQCQSFAGPRISTVSQARA
jgi:hypothetical protein